MPLVVDSLESALETQWLVAEGGSFPQSAMESGDRFAGAFCTWFAGAMAATFSCVTAMARRSQLATQAGAALDTQDSSLAGNQLAMAVASYIAGQSFPPGTALFPTALTAAAAQMSSTFADPGVDVGSKAQEIAAACHLLVVSTLVAIPTPPGPPTAPIT
jgi:hypothetical protein